MSTVITLTTDFGLADAYVAVMKGVILGINPDTQIVDICHTIKPQDVTQASFILSTAHRFFPERTIHLVVVDPGVGSQRRAIILRTPSADFIAPDNGVLSYILHDFIPIPRQKPAEQEQMKLPAELEAVTITNPEFWRSPVSPTFHGRDIFAPVAAHLSLGVPPADFGEKITSLTMLPLRQPSRKDDGSLAGNIIYIDHFGNLITSIRSEDLPPQEETISIEVGGQRIKGLSRTYAEGTGLIALTGSSGYLEVSLKEGNARDFLNINIGDEIIIRRWSTHNDVVR